MAVTYAKLHIVLNGFFIIFLWIIGEVIDRDVVVIDVLNNLYSFASAVAEKWIPGYILSS